MTTRIVLLKIRAVWVDAMSGESVWERKAVQWAVAFLGVGIGICSILWLFGGE